MSLTETPDGAADHGEDVAVEARSTGPRNVGSLNGGVIVCLLALLLVVTGAWALWKDRVDRDGAGFVTIGSSHLHTETYAIVGDLSGDGPSWLYGATVLGDTRVRATSQHDGPLFVGVARTDDVFRYLRGVGYATIDSFEVRKDTTHTGDAPSEPPATQSIWAAQTDGTARQSLVWRPRHGEWSVVFMNADASADVDVRGDGGAELPALPWVAGGFLIVGVAVGFAGVRLVLRAAR
jgi:hypothetical protein